MNNQLFKTIKNEKLEIMNTILFLKATKFLFQFPTWRAATNLVALDHTKINLAIYIRNHPAIQ